jgi:hypothetical protein
MNIKVESPYLPDDSVIPKVLNERHNKGWNDRKFQDFSIIEEALRKSGKFREFTAELRERMEKLGE